MPFSIKRNKNIAESSIHVSMASRHKKGPVVSGLFLPSAYARRPASIGHVLSIQQYLPLTTLISIQSHLIACFWHVLALFARNKNTAESSPADLPNEHPYRRDCSRHRQQEEQATACSGLIRDPGSRHSDRCRCPEPPQQKKPA